MDIKDLPLNLDALTALVEDADLSGWTPPACDAAYLTLSWESERVAGRIAALNNRLAQVANPTSRARYEAERDGYRTDLDYLQMLTCKLTVQYRTRRWSRYYLVAGSGGHFHKGCNCPTCYPETQMSLVPAYSGATGPDLIAAQGWRVCTFCFPDAPVLPPGVVTAERAKAAKLSRVERSINTWRNNLASAEKALDDAVEKAAYTYDDWIANKVERMVKFCLHSAMTDSEANMTEDEQRARWTEVYAKDRETARQKADYEQDLAQAKRSISYRKGEIAQAKRKLRALGVTI